MGTIEPRRHWLALLRLCDLGHGSSGGRGTTEELDLRSEGLGRPACKTSGHERPCTRMSKDSGTERILEKEAPALKHNTYPIAV